MFNDLKEIDLPLSKEVAMQGAKKIKAVDVLKKNWRFVAICITVLLCVAMVCGTVYGVTCQIATLDTLKEIAYATEIIYETEKTADANGGGVANVGDRNTITMGGE